MVQGQMRYSVHH